MEGAHFIKTGQLVSLSEQNLIDCDHFDYGCEGGMPEAAITFAIENGGIESEYSYPYKGQDLNTCKFNSSEVGATFNDVQRIPYMNEQAMQQAVALNGPVCLY